jgi:rubrerythrin
VSKYTDQPIDRYPTTQTITCQTCDWRYSQTNGVPETCPMCEHRKRKPALDAVLKKNSDLKGK